MIALPQAAPKRPEYFKFERSNGIDFLWLELTNRCNLQCIHCYSDSHPNSGHNDYLTKSDYEQLIRDAYQLGCRKIQFIGGEPQLNRDLHHFIELTTDLGYEFVEIFTNLTRLDDKIIRLTTDRRIHFATSIYSQNERDHDAITKVRGSHHRTVNNLRKIIENGIDVRVAIVVINQSDIDVVQTRAFLNDLGVLEINIDRVRDFGRATSASSSEDGLHALCGQCWKSKLCVSPTGAAFPCIMSRSLTVGNVLTTPLSEIVGGKPLWDGRKKIHDFFLSHGLNCDCSPDDCIPHFLSPPGRCGPAASHPCAPGCAPDSPCSPSSGCSPLLHCNPDFRPPCGPDQG